MYQSKYKGKQIDEAVSQATDKLPIRMNDAESNISDIKQNKADKDSVPTKLSQLTDDVGLANTKQTAKNNETSVSLLKNEVSQLTETVENLNLTGGGDGAILISVHDDLTFIPDEGQMYIIKYHDMPYGEDPSLISPEVFYRLRIGDGITPLADLPNVSNIVAGTGNGSAILVDPTYDNGDDGLEAPKNVADAQYAVSLGKYLKNHGKASLLVGYSSENYAPRAFMAGMSNLATEEAVRAFVSGYKQLAKAIGAGLFGGGNNTVEAQNGTILGGRLNHLLANAIDAILVGNGLISDTQEQVVLGKYNEEDNDALIIFGAGTSDTDRKNVFKVMRNGTVELLGTVRINGEELDFEAIDEATAIPQQLKAAVAETAIPQSMYVDTNGSLAFEDMDGEVKELPEYKFTRSGHSDVTSYDATRYTEYPTEGSGSDRQWAYLGTNSASSSSAGYFTSLGGSYVACYHNPDAWTAFRIKIPESGEYTVFADYNKFTGGGTIETYILPMSEEIETEFAAGNTETYGTVASTGNGNSLERTGGKAFSALTSIAGASPIGEAINTYGTVSSGEWAYDAKIGVVSAEEGEYLLLFRSVPNSAKYNFRLANLTFTKFEPFTNAIKVGDTVLTEEELLDLKTHRGEIDDINAQLGDISTALDDIVAITEAYINADSVVIGSTEYDLSKYATTEYVDEAIDTAIEPLATTEYVDTSIQEAVLDSWEEEV